MQASAPAPASGEAPGRSVGPARRTALIAVGLALLILVSYFPALSAGFVWDDLVFADEPLIRDGLSGLSRIWFAPREITYEGHYWPLVYTSFWLEYQLWGLAPLGYHVVNLLLHLGCTVLVWRLLLQLPVPGAALIAAVFAVHPLHVESVAWVIERKDLLSTLFYLGAFRAWLRYLEDSRTTRYAGSLLLFVAALLSKSIAVTLPAWLLIHRFWKTGRIGGTDLLRTAPFFLTAAVITVADVAFYRTREVLTFDHSLPERLLIAGRALWFYAGRLLWPGDMPVIYPRWEIRAGDWAGWVWPVAALVSAALLWVLRGRLGRGPLVGAAFFAVTLSPVLGFVDYGYMQFAYVADRFQYLAGLGLMAVAVGVATSGVERLGPNLRRASAVAFAGILLFFSVATFRQARIYRDPPTFFGHITERNPDARDAWLNLGTALTDAGRHEEALPAAREALRTTANVASAHSNLGLALLNVERFEEAEAELRRALVLEPDHAKAIQNLAEVTRRQGDSEGAIPLFREAVDRDPGNGLARAGLGQVLFETGRHEEAAEAILGALELEPDLAAATAMRLMAAESLRRLRRFDEASEQVERLVAGAPDDPVALAHLANLRAEQGRAGEADALLRRVRRLRPEEPGVLQNMAESLRRQQRYEEALEAYGAVLDLDPDFGSAHAGRSSALFELGRYDEAVEAMERALVLEPVESVLPAREVLIGKALLELERPPEDAAERFQRALEVNPRHPDALDRLGAVRFAQRRFEEALELYERQIEDDPENAAIHSNIGATLFRLGRREAAVRSLERALELDPDHEPARRNLEGVRSVERR